MASLVPVLLLLVQGVVVTRATLPEGYILKVNRTCGDRITHGAEVTILTDLMVEAVAICDGSTQPFVTNDNVHYLLPVAYPSLGQQACKFKKQNDTEDYSIKVVVSFADIGPMHHEDREFTVTCSFEPERADNGENPDLVDGLVAPVEMESESKGRGPTVTLRIMDDGGNDMTESRVAVGRSIVLQATAAGVTANERGLRPVSCDAVGNGERYPIIRDGCGDGIVFGKTEGFHTHGLRSTSPHFDAFRFHDGDVVQFECNFTFCSNNCDGTSCPFGAERRRRSEKGSDKFLKEARTKISVTPRGPRNVTQGKVVFVRKALQDQTASPAFADPYFVVPVAVLGILALISFLIASCACARRDYSQLYEVSKEPKIIESYDWPIGVRPRAKGGETSKGLCDSDCVGISSKACGCPRRNLQRLACVPVCDKNLCNNLGLCDNEPSDPKLCNGDCTEPCNTESGGKCAVNCKNVCNK